LDGRWLPADWSLARWLGLPRVEALRRLRRARGSGGVAVGAALAPVAAEHGVWAAGVTYLRSREARRSESGAARLYDHVYEAERPELFLKATGARVVGAGGAIRARRDSRWSVPEPELTVVVNRHLEVVAFTAGNDVSARDVEGENPLYLPQAKLYDGACALGPALQVADAAAVADLEVRLRIERAGAVAFEGATRTSRMRRRVEELVAWLGRELSFGAGAFLMTGTGIVPPDGFTLAAGDVVTVGVGDLELTNPVG
jgi:2-dehydro-3-deoxy-D-arabinonate dehydratase